MIYTLIVILLILFLITFLYNRFVRLDNMVQEAWSDVDVQLKRRYSLIPNLVTIAKEYMKYESKTLKEIVTLRNTAIHQKTPAQKEDAENQLTANLKHIFAVAEQYPDLKANDQFKELANNLAEIEDTLQDARRYYNATVRDYNIALHTFPSNVVASFLKLQDKTYFEIANFEKKEIKVKFHEK